MSDRLRAIDALIAGHCMGFSDIQNGPDGLEGVLEKIPCRQSDKTFGHMVRFAPIPPYSSDPAASTQARDKMRGLGWTVTVEGWKSFDHDEFCVSLRIYEDQAWQCQKDIRGEDEFLCVALAILAALQIEVPE